MGLYVNHLKTIRFETDRTLYIYLLNYGWPDGDWENIFKRHFMTIADKASDAGAAVISSPRGIHFANEVLNYHRVGELDPDRVLPGILLTKTDPSYFAETHATMPSNSEALGEVVVIPLRDFCTSEEDFIRGVESIFSDLEKKQKLRNFEVSQYDALSARIPDRFERSVQCIELKPNFFGFGIDLKKLFGW